MSQYRPGDSIRGEYSVLRVFGGEKRSGMGVVYLVQSRDSPGPFVLKTYQSTISPDSKLRFRTEARAWINAGAHANIVQAYWVEEMDGQLYVAAEYVPTDEIGRNNLSHFISAAPLPIEVALNWSAQFCYGMEYARSKGVLAHRDIKPDNLMIDSDGTLKVTDFGLAKSLGSNLSVEGWGSPGVGKSGPISATRTGSLLGTPLYISPEQLIDAKASDHRADIYSFGIVLYQAVTGEYPYAVDSGKSDVIAELLAAHTKMSPIPADSPVMPIISRCLEKDPRRRYQSYDHLLADIQKLAKQLRIRITPVSMRDGEAEEIYARAKSLSALGDKGGALAAINEYVAKFSMNFCGWTEKGRIHLVRGEYKEALDSTKRSIELNGYNTHSWNNLGLCLKHVGAPSEEVLKAFDTAIRLDPFNAGAMANAIAPLMAIEEYDQAESLASKALRLSPERPSANQNATALLLTLLEKRLFHVAERLLMAWTQARPVDAQAWHNLGIVSIAMKKTDKAIECFLEVQRLDPKDEFSVEQLAKLYYDNKKGKECLRWCNELLRRRYKEMLAVSLKARVMNFMGAYEQALAFIDPYLRHNPDNDALWVILSEIHEFRENYSAAIDALKRAETLLRKQDAPNAALHLKIVLAKLHDLKNRMNE